MTTSMAMALKMASREPRLKTWIRPLLRLRGLEKTEKDCKGNFQVYLAYFKCLKHNFNLLF